HLVADVVDSAGLEADFGERARDGRSAAGVGDLHVGGVDHVAGAQDDIGHTAAVEAVAGEPPAPEKIDRRRPFAHHQGVAGAVGDGSHGDFSGGVKVAADNDAAFIADGPSGTVGVLPLDADDAEIFSVGNGGDVRAAAALSDVLNREIPRLGRTD